MTRFVYSYLVLVLCLTALGGSQASGVRTTTLYGSAAPTVAAAPTTLYGSAAPTVAAAPTTLYGSAAPTAAAAPTTLYGSAAPTVAAAPTATSADQVASPQNAAAAPQTSTPTTVFPPSGLQIFAVDIHFVAGYNFTNAYIAYHYCGAGPGVTQCAIYDGTGSDAKLIAVEIIVPASVFETFSTREKRLWHSHTFAIQAGIFVLPELSPQAEHDALAGLSGTYGKVTDFYQPNTAEPTGSAQTSFGITNQAQLNLVLDLARQIDSGLNLTTTYQQRAAARSDFPAITPVAGQDPFHQSGLLPQYAVELYRVNTTTGIPL